MSDVQGQPQGGSGASGARPGGVLVREWLGAYRNSMLRAGRSFANGATGAQDIVQEAGLVAWRKRDLAPEIRNPRAWLVSITRLVGLRVYTKSRRRRTLAAGLVRDPPGWLDHGDPVHDQYRDEAHCELVERVVAWAEQLPPSQRRVVRYKLLEGMNNRAVARKMGISVATVRVHTCRAVARMKAQRDLGRVRRGGRAGLNVTGWT